MSPKSGLLVAVTTLAALAVGGVVIIGSVTNGDALRASPPPAFTGGLPSELAPPAAFPAKPHTTLHLPSTLHFISQDTGGVTLDSTHSLFNAGLVHPNSKKIVGTGSYTCVADIKVTLQTCEGALALRQGILLVSESFDITHGDVVGKVLGGTGYYAGARGTLTGSEKGGGRTTLNIHYNFT